MTKPKKRILIIDDDPDIRETVRLAIQEQNFMDIHFAEGSSVASGIQQLKKFKPEIVILDLHLQGKNGFDFMDIMNKHKEFKHIKVIMLTVDDTLPNIFKAEDKGIDANYFLGKPFNISDLQSLVLSMGLLPKT